MLTRVSQFLQVVTYNLTQYGLLQWNLEITKGQGTDKFVITKFRYIEVLFHAFYYHWGEENHSLYRGLRYIEDRYIEVPLYLLVRVAFSAFYRQDGGFIPTGWWCISTQAVVQTQNVLETYEKMRLPPLCYLQAPKILNSLPANVKIRCTFDKPSWQFHQTM